MAAFPSLITGLFWLAVLGIGAGTLRRASLWRAGRSAPTRWLDLLAVPKRYFVDLHHVVARDPYIARTHIATAGAAVAAMLLVALNYGLALYWQFLDMAIALAALVMLTGLAFVWLRRRHPPARLSRGLWNRLPWMLGALALGLLLLGALPAAWLAGLTGLGTAALLAVGAWELTVGLARGGPMSTRLPACCTWPSTPAPNVSARRRAASSRPCARCRWTARRWASARRRRSPGSSC